MTEQESQRIVYAATKVLAAWHSGDDLDDIDFEELDAALAAIPVTEKVTLGLL